MKFFNRKKTAEPLESFDEFTASSVKYSMKITEFSKFKYKYPNVPMPIKSYLGRDFRVDKYCYFTHPSFEELEFEPGFFNGDIFYMSTNGSICIFRSKEYTKEEEESCRKKLKEYERKKEESRKKMLDAIKKTSDGQDLTLYGKKCTLDVFLKENRPRVHRTTNKKQKQTK